MDLTGKTAAVVTPVKDSPQSVRSKFSATSKFSENLNPNVSSSSPVIRSVKGQKSASKKPSPVKMVSPRNKIRERRFVVARKISKKEKAVLNMACKCKEKNLDNGVNKCLCVAYETLRASQEEFCKNRSNENEEKYGDEADYEEVEKIIIENQEGETDLFNKGFFSDLDEAEVRNGMGNSTLKRHRDKMLEEARRSLPDQGSGLVMHLVKAFEKLVSIPNLEESDQKYEKGTEERKQTDSESKNSKIMKWPLPGLRQQEQEEPIVSEIQDPLSSIFPSDLVLTSENLGLDSQLTSSWDSSRGRSSDGGQRSRRNSSGSSGTIGGSRWKKKQLRLTNKRPFKLQTEQRGRLKEEELMKKIQKMMEEEERLRIPRAQGLPWTTDEPECLTKPPVKENTIPMDLKLHTDMRAVERAEFDQQVAEKINWMEQYKIERERQQKLEEEEAIRRIRKELVPKAQPMPYFDRPFIPRRSTKNPTIPREPKFHIPQQKKIKCCLSWNDMSSYTFH